ncbi:hypothetical protein F4560_001044 [Saccharothrix ecbatanensis]|uniref:Zinc finger protein n=1 Tax=Saccharothrix ecbatanensis TaxID=1105145 RepID=A0A7W9HG08_9PSEU|nr:zinc finger protein [Saccharothrix ecbatanensis]MBB5801276.1 hypothetical protein [Saccharothrix ecbatanensis]
MTDTVPPPLYRWYPHVGGRHAIPFVAAPGDEIKTVCGEDITLPRVLPKLACEPECAMCDAGWRAEINAKPRPSFGRVPTQRRYAVLTAARGCIPVGKDSTS